MDELLKDFLKFIGAVIIWIGFLGQKPFMDILQTSKWKGWVGLLAMLITIGVAMYLYAPK